MTVVRNSIFLRDFGKLIIKFRRVKTSLIDIPYRNNALNQLCVRKFLYEEMIQMPAIRINTQDKDLAEKTFHIIMRNCGFDYLPGEIYVVRERDLEWIIDKGLPIEVLSEEEVRKSVSEFKRNLSTSNQSLQRKISTKGNFNSLMDSGKNRVE